MLHKFMFCEYYFGIEIFSADLSIQFFFNPSYSFAQACDEKFKNGFSSEFFVCK